MAELKGGWMNGYDWLAVEALMFTGVTLTAKPLSFNLSTTEVLLCLIGIV